VAQIIEPIEDNPESVQDIYIEPPDPAVLSDEDSGDEDTGGLIDNLSGNQLRARAEVVYNDVHRLGADREEKDEEEAADGEVDAAVQQSKLKKRPVQAPKRLYKFIKNGDVSGIVLPYQEQNYSMYRVFSPIELFDLFLPNEFFEHLDIETNKYAAFKNEVGFVVTLNKMKVFIAILILCGFCVLPSKISFWDSGNDLRNKMVYNAMRKNRLCKIMQFIHCSDNTQPNFDDKMWKLRPLIEIFKEINKNLLIIDGYFSYDEAMVAYYGKHSCKQFIRGKPIRFGYKIWRLNDVCGFLVDFDIYQGTMPGRNEEFEKQYGKCTAPLLTFIDQLPVDFKQLHLSFYFDNLLPLFNSWYICIIVVMVVLVL
jgi:hypothetical protein